MADLDVIIKQMILSTLRSAKMDSASPGHVNRFIGLEGGVSDIIGSNEEINAAIREAVADITSDPDSADTLSQDLLDSEVKTGKIKSTSVSSAFSAARAGADPVDFLQVYAKTLVPILLPLLVAAGLSELIIETSLSPGGILDRRLRRYITQEINGFLDKQTQKNNQIGVRQVIIQSRAGFRNINGIASEDSLRQIKLGGGNGLRKSALDYIDFSKGVRDLRE